MPIGQLLSLPEDSAMFDPEFIFGVATAAFQIEGGADSRLPNIWDTFCEQPGKIVDGSDGRIACNHIELLEEDLDLLAELNVDAYRFSISWGRVMNADGSSNASGLAFYRQLAKGLRDRNIKSWATLYHWDLPQLIEERGGWLSRSTAFEFQRYADTVSRELAGMIDAWSTLNEPMCSAYLGYATGLHAPGGTDITNHLKAAHHLLLAHGLGMQVLTENVGDASKGIAVNLSPTHPASDRAEDIKAAQVANDTLFRWYLEPLLNGRYPELLATLPAERKPDIHDGDLEIIHQPLDFLGINYYTRSTYASAGVEGFEQIEATGSLTDMGWEVYPSGLTQMLVELDQRYSLPPVYITENGAAFPDEILNGVVHDPQRLNYIQTHLLAVDEAIRQGVDVKGFFYWSFMDNFEWAEGYRKRFGIVHVDYETLVRTVKTSGQAWSSFLGARSGPETRKTKVSLGI